MKAISPIIALLFSLLLLVPGQCERLNYSADFSGVSNYIFRGQSLSDDGFAAQAGFNISNDAGWKYRFFVSSYDVNGDTDGRAEFSLAYRGEADKYFHFMFGVTAYGYESEDRESHEWHVGLEAFDASVIYYRDEELNTQYYDFAYFYELNDDIRFDAHYGIASPVNGEGTSEDYSVTATYRWLEDLSVFVTGGSHNELESFGLIGATYYLDW
ncbi:TorF family putative porin [Pleionea sediminis]|uniref:TorF family putative porin n=1 Tax=Pleionea sediminis TaxID=2569479 RepID=UPI001186676B|nr:TorF family putative porin [Pleionea sediminis]